MKNLFLLSFLFLTAAATDVFNKFRVNNKLITYKLYWEHSIALDGNFLFSPLSTQTVLALAALGAGEDTAKEITKAAYLPNALPRVTDIYKKVQEYLLSSPALSIYNEVFAGVHTLNYRYAFLIQVAFGAVITRDEIHSVDKFTISSNVLIFSHALGITSHLNLNTQWIHNFLPYGSMPFTRMDGREVDMEMVHTTTPALLGEDTAGKVYFIEFPFVDKNISLTLIFPKKKEYFWDLEKDFPQLVYNEMRQEVLLDIVLPDLGMFYGGKLTSKLNLLGIKSAFSENADFSRIAYVDQKIEDGVQGSVFNITQIPVVKGSKGDNLPMVNLTLTHPFMFFLKHKVLGILLIGRCVKQTEVGSNSLEKPFFNVWQVREQL